MAPIISDGPRPAHLFVGGVWHPVRMLADQRRPTIRELDESAAPHNYWYGVDAEGGRWLFESIEGDGEHWAVKEVEIGADGRIWRYWWNHLEDHHGFLTDQALNPREDDLAELTPEAFFEVWAATTCECGSPPG
jgi:hypothetical protein